MKGLATERNFQMAKSIYALLDDLETETSVPEVKDKNGNVVRKHFGMVSHTLPRESLPTSEEFEDAEKLLAWAKDTGVLHACLQSGIQSRIIDLRAIFKAYKKDEEWSPSYGQDNVDNAEWKVVKRPQKTDKEAVKRQATFDANMAIATAMKSTKGITAKMIKDTLIASCGEDMANEIIDKLS